MCLHETYTRVREDRFLSKAFSIHSWVRVGAESNGKLPHLLIPGKTAVLVPEFAVEVLPLAELQS